MKLKRYKESLKGGEKGPKGGSAGLRLREGGGEKKDSKKRLESRELGKRLRDVESVLLQADECPSL